MSSDTIGFGGSRNFSALIINKNRTFIYQYRTSLSCFVWYDCNGKWEIKNNDELVLKDSIWSFRSVVDFTKYIDTDDNQILIKIKTKEDKPLTGIKITYLYKESKDTLTGYTNSEGNFAIYTNDKERTKKSGKIRSIDDVEIWVNYFDKKQRDQSTNTFSNLSSEIECVIDDNAVDERILRITTYKINGRELVYTSQSFSSSDAQPGGYLFGNFKLVTSK